MQRIPVYVLNALYLAPITLWTYFNYGRPPTAKLKPSDPGSQFVSPNRFFFAKSERADVLLQGP